MINRASVQLWGHSETIGRPAKIGREKKGFKILCTIGCTILRHGSDFIYTKISARPGSDFIYTKNSGGEGGGDVDYKGCFTIVKCIAKKTY